MAVNNGIASASTIWDALDAATRARTAFTLGFLSTAGIDGQPHVRAVILREADADAGTVFFSTHVLSAKVGEIEQNPLVAITFYDAVRMCSCASRAGPSSSPSSASVEPLGTPSAREPSSCSRRR